MSQRFPLWHWEIHWTYIQFCWFPTLFPVSNDSEIPIPALLEIPQAGMDVSKNDQTPGNGGPLRWQKHLDWCIETQNLSAAPSFISQREWDQPSQNPTTNYPVLVLSTGIISICCVLEIISNQIWILGDWPPKSPKLTGLGCQTPACFHTGVYEQN